WFKRFRSGDFDTEDKERSGRPKTIEDADLQALLDEDDTQTQDQLAEALNMTRQGISKRLHAMGKIQEEGKWVLHELTERQMENRRATSEILLLRHERKSFLHRIVTGDEKWIYFENPKRKKSCLSPGKASTSMARPNRFGK
ncbi:Histone-lysine N-methyltransferase SETMAR, partial [Harpegnathos saltator]